MSSPRENQPSRTDNRDNADQHSAMSAAVQGAQSAYSATYSTLLQVSQQFEQGLQETQAAMGELLRSSIRIESEMKSMPFSVRLTVHISNIGPAPLPNATCRLAFERPRQEQQPIADDEVSWTFVSGHAEKTPMQPMHHRDEHRSDRTSIPSLFDTPLTLQPGTQYVQVVDIKSKAPAQYNGILSVAFSVVDEQPMQEYHRFGVYLVDQMQKMRIVPKDIQAMYHRHYWHAFLQHILTLDLDLDEDAHIALQPYQPGTEKSRILCAVRSAGDGPKGLAEVTFGAETADGLALLERLVNELDMLHGGD